MKLPFWLLRLLPMWDYICPKCRREVKQKSHKCCYCGENYGKPVHVPPKMLKDRERLEEYVHKHIFPKISVKQRRYLTEFFTVVFQDGMESAALPGNWTGNSVSGFTQSFTTAEYHHGAKSLIQTGGNAISEYAKLYKTITSAVEYHMRLYVMLGTLGSRNVTTWVGPCLLSSADANIAGGAIRKELDGARNWAVINGGMSPHTAYHAADSTINAFQWYCLEIDCYVAASPNGFIKLEVDGIEVISQTGITTNDHGNIARGGALTYTENGAYDLIDCDFFYDCAVIADAHIGVEGEAAPAGILVQVM